MVKPLPGPFFAFLRRTTPTVLRRKVTASGSLSQSNPELYRQLRASPFNPYGIPSNINSGIRIPLTRTTDVESAMGMELLLNLAWVLLAALMFCLWLRFAPRTGVNPRLQFVALAVLLLILFPVISVTDDLQAAQNPAEADCLVRRDHGCATPHSMRPLIALLPLPAVTGPNFAGQRLTILGSLDVQVLNHPAMAPIQNRPPPVA